MKNNIEIKNAISTSSAHCIIRRALCIIGYAFCIVALYSCGNGDSEETIQKKNRREAFVEDSLSFKVGVLPTEDCYPVLVAEQLGLFEKNGVSVHLRKYNALSECRYALAKGSIEAAYVDSLLAETIQKEDTTQLTIGPSTALTWKLISSKKSRVSRVAQLKDKIIAADSHGYSKVLAESAIDSLLKKQNNVFIIQVEDVEVRCDMLTTGNVDAAMLPEPYATKAIRAGGKILKDYSDRKKGVVAIRKKALSDKRIDEQYKKFLECCRMAQDSIAKQPSRFAKLIINNSFSRFAL